MIEIFVSEIFSIALDIESKTVSVFPTSINFADLKGISLLSLLFNFEIAIYILLLESIFRLFNIFSNTNEFPILKRYSWDLKLYFGKLTFPARIKIAKLSLLKLFFININYIFYKVIYKNPSFFQ